VYRYLIEPKAARQCRGRPVHSSLPKGTADKSDPYAAAPRQLAHGCHVQLLDVTVNQNLRELERRGRTDICNRNVFPSFDRDLLGST
jgi:hypothetical protein